MEENKVYEIYEILAAAAEWMEDPENEEKNKKLEEIRNNLIVKEYMPLQQKTMCLQKALIDMRVDGEVTPYEASTLYEMALFFDCLLVYVVNLNQNIDILFKEPDFYDLLHISGIAEHILSYCYEDYEVILKMAERAISFDNLTQLTKMIAVTSPEEVNRLTKEIEEFHSKMDKDSLKALADIMTANDPLTARIKKGIEDGAYTAMNEIAAAEGGEDSKEE